MFGKKRENTDIFKVRKSLNTPMFGKKWENTDIFKVRKSLNTHGTLSVYLLCRLLTLSCFQRIGSAKSSIVGLKVIERFNQP